jgi:primosomal protein N' (replication factor Y)
MRRAGVAVAHVPDGWAVAAAGGCSVVGARGATWAPCPGLAAVVVVDAHDEALIEDRAPAWSAWVVAAERARRAGVPCVLISATPTLEQLAWGALVLPSRAAERAGWPPLTVIDRRADDPRTGLFNPRIVPLVRSATVENPVVCVLNRKGRGRLLACASCREIAVCERCRSAVELVEGATLRCRSGGLVRPVVCLSCGAGRMKVLRAGVTRVREELEALAGLPVASVTSETGQLPEAAVLVGTEAVLRRARSAHAVIFLDFDAELLAPRYRAGEQALALLARAARLVGRRAGGLVAVQTRQPDHPVVQSAVRADPGRLVEAELPVRQALRLPPVTALAQLSGEGAADFAAALADVDAVEAEILGPDDAGRWLVRATGHVALCDALAGAARPAARLRVDVDPVRI